MKMAEEPSSLTLHTGGEEPDPRGAQNEKIDNSDGDITGNDGAGRPGDEPRAPDLDSLDLLSQEAAVDEFLAGDSKGDEILMLAEGNVANEEDAIDFKQDNELEGCEQLVRDAFADRADEKRRMIRELKRRAESYNRRPHWWLLRSLKRRSIKYLNKMHVMEDVREACDVQPSSPGHAEQGPEAEQVVQNPPKENGCEKAPEEKEDEPKPAADTGKPDNSPDSKEAENETSDGENKKKESDVENGSNMNEDTTSNDSGESKKRKADVDESLVVKKLRSEIQENYTIRDKILSEYMNLGDCSSLEQIHTYTEQVLAEIKTLNDLAREKEKEWNNIIHLKKLKEELLLRIQRRKQILLLNSDKNDGSETESQFDPSDERKPTAKPKSATLKVPNVHQDKPKQKSLLNSALEMNGQSMDLNKSLGKQRPVLDVQSIIADYRQRHPEAVPRRGRRIRSSLNSQSENGRTNAGGVMNFSSVALGAGSQVRQNLGGFDVNSELGLLLSAMDSANSRPSVESTNPPQSETCFRDMLVQFAKLSQSERHELIQNAIKPPPPYPEVTVHPVSTSPQPQTPSNSLLHGILTKSPSKPNSKSSFSPTLARLLTAPERAAMNSSHTHLPNSSASVANVSISDILSTSKARNEITITPVGQFESSKDKEEEEAEDSADRLVIDESNEPVDARNRSDNNSDVGDEVPQCQGCNQRPAQFVCAGCGNQWYCSRDCQVSAWDEHSEVCSG